VLFFGQKKASLPLSVLVETMTEAGIRGARRTVHTHTYYIWFIGGVILTSIQSILAIMLFTFSYTA
jgi:hypothetical protein